MRNPDAAIRALRRTSWVATGAVAAALVLANLAGCASAPAGPAGRDALPPIPEVRGELSLYVAYPDSLDPIFAADSNFVFGTTGTGGAELRVNGHPVSVHPNGSFLAWLPVPEPTAGDTASYRLVARAGGRADTLIHRFRVPMMAARNRPALWVDTATADQPERWALPDEEVELSIAAAPGLDVGLTIRRSAWWAATRDTAAATPGGEGARGPSDAARARSRVERGLRVREVAPGRYVARAGAMELLSGLGSRDGPSGPRLGVGGGTEGILAADTLELRWRLADGGDTIDVAGDLALRALDPRRPPTGELREEPDPVHGRAGAVAARPSPNGSYAWLLPTGSRAPVTARAGDRIRLRLGPGLSAWAAAEDVELGPPERSPTRGAGATAGVGRVTAEPLEDRVRIRMPVDRRLPAHASPEGARALAVTVHGGLGETERMRYPVGDGLVRGLRWRQLPGPRWRLTVELDRPVWGWDLRWQGVTPEPAGEGDGGGEGGATAERPVLVLDVRRPPRLDPRNPLAGVRVAVDPGHPPVGAEGPTGLTEADANLRVARGLARALRASGAEPVMVRSDTAPVGLYERRRRAREAGAHVLVSVHNNALPDGVRPFDEGGTSTYYFHPHARELARRVQRGMLDRMGLRDRGVRWGNLALPRESWMPSVLTEGAFMMIPRHEAALRTKRFRQAYADGVLQGLRRWLRARAERNGG